MFLKEKYGNWINGEEVFGESSVPVENPYNQKVVTRVAEASKEEVDAAIDLAKEAFDDGRWSKLSGKERGRVLQKAALLLRERVEKLAEIESICTGRAIKEMKAQLGRIPEWLEYFGAMAFTAEGSVPPFSDNNHLNYVKRVPLGVCALITPWNHPLLIATKKVAPALAAGNSIVVKPSELAPIAVIELAKILEEAGLPRGVMHVVNGYGAVTGRALTESSICAKVDLTGGTVTGKLVAAAAGRNLARCCMELGGNAPVLVFEDADIVEAVNGIAFAAFVASGQTCISAKRIIVHESIFDEFVTKISEKANAIRLGDPMDSDTQMGPVVSETQLKVVEGAVVKALEEGARASAGGKRPNADRESLQLGYFFEPTVLVDVKPSMLCFQEEIFGPVISVSKFSSEAEALALANDNK
mmetsp:Transcript_31847/g.83132  ORF Transcript_31847/g.83132 Transcript_31847/m.83132 type:complete len:414 (-) Transcript_31847:71-1312(-)